MRRPIQILAVSGLLLAGIQLYRSFLVLPAFRSFALTVVSLFLEGLPFLLLGSAAAAVVRSFLPADVLPRLERRAGVFGLPLVALTGLLAPVCECAIVPTVRSLRDRGLSLPYAITVLTSVPIVNPIVIASTIAAFPGRSSMVIARVGGGWLVALLTGLVFSLAPTAASTRPAPGGLNGRRRNAGGPGAGESLPAGHSHTTGHVAAHTRWSQRLLALTREMLHEFLEVSRYFMTGVLLASLVQVLVAPERFAVLRSYEFAAILMMIGLAWMLSVCSEADAFIGKAFLPMLPSSAVLAFLVFGPMLDLKNTVMLRRMLTPRQIALLSVTLLVAVSLYARLIGGFWQ